MFGVKLILSIFLVTFSIGRANSSSYRSVCDDTEGVVAHGSPCYRTCWLWLFYCKVECTSYTCDNIPCDNDIAKEVCPGTCTECTTVIDLAESDKSSFSTLLSFLDTAGFVSALETEGPFTVFAPTNDAFENLDQAIRDNYMKEEWREHLRSLLLYHILFGEVFSSDITTDNLELQTVEGSNIIASLGTFEVNGVTVTSKDISASNGVVQVIDQVLLPPSAFMTIVDYLADGSRSDVFSTLVELVTTARRNLFNLDELFEDRPEFEKEPEEKDTEPGSDDKKDLIDLIRVGEDEELLVLPQPIVSQPPEELQLAEVAPTPEETTVIDEAQTSDDSLIELLSSLEPLGPFTIFAPTNIAFEKIDGVIDTDNKVEVTKILQYHVLKGIILSDQITDGFEAETLLEGEKITFSSYSDHVIINDDAYVSNKDILVSNGVIHVIDEVLLPSDYEKPCSDIKSTFRVWNNIDEEYTCDDIGASYFTWFYCIFFSDYCPHTCGLCS